MVIIKKLRNMLKSIFFLLIIVLSMNKCKKTDKMDDELSISRTPYTGTELRIDGYYYSNYFENNITVYFPYRNGVLIYGASFDIEEIAKYETQYRNGEFYKKFKEIKYFWGVFKVEENQISIERWSPSQPPYKAFVEVGEILNDTTFLITESYRNQNGVKTLIEKRNLTFNFKEFSPKPDSTNSFID